MSNWDRIVPLQTEFWYGSTRVTSYGYAQADPQRKSRRKKRPLGFVLPEPPAKPRRRAAKPPKETDQSES